MPSLYTTDRRRHRCFYNYAVRRHGAASAYPWDQILKPLSMLPAQWFPQAFKILKPYISNGDPAGAYNRLNLVYKIIDDFESVGLSFTPRIANLASAFQLLPLHLKEHFKTQSLFSREVIRLIEQSGQWLHMHRIEQTPVTSIGQMLLRQHEGNTVQIMKNTRLRYGFGARGPTLAQVAAGQKERQAAERRHRASSLIDYYVKDCGFVWRGAVITAGPEHSPGYGQTANEKWIAAGCPTPKQTHQIMMKLLGNLVSACKSEGVKLRGFRIVEAFKSGVPHYNIMLFFKNDEDAAVFERHLHRLFPEVAQNGPLKKADEQRVCVVKDDDPNIWANYIQKGLPRWIDDEEGNKRFIDISEDSDWCSVWGIKQFTFFGQEPIESWRSLQKLTDGSRLLAHNDVPEAVKAAYRAASGLAIVDGKAVQINHDYRAFLRLTETTSPRRFSQHNGPAVQFLQTDFKGLGSVISVVCALGKGIDIAIPNGVIEELRDDVTPTLLPELEFSIRLPSTPRAEAHLRRLLYRKPFKTRIPWSFGARNA